MSQADADRTLKRRRDGEEGREWLGRRSLLGSRLVSRLVPKGALLITSISLTMTERGPIDPPDL